MKKALSIVLALILIACAVNFTSLYSVSALNENSDVDEYKYVFSERNYDELQLTDVELQSDTVTLLNLILEANWINPLISSTSDYTEYPYIANRFNGLQELEKRADASQVMVQRYMEETLKYSNGYGGSMELAQLNVLLSQDIYKNELTTNDINALKIADVCLENQAQWPTVTVLCNVE